VKRLIVLLVVLAGGLIAAALSVPSNAAVVNGTAISQQALNADVTAIAGSPEYQCYLNAQTAIASSGQSQLPPVAGAGKGQGGQSATATTAFVASYLDTEVGHQLILQLAERRGVVVTPDLSAGARTAYEDEISTVMSQAAQSQDPRYTCGAAEPLTGQQVLSTLPSWFVDEQVQFQATVEALQEDVSGVGSSPAELQRYFDEHRSAFDTACWTAAVYSSEAAANTALAQAQGTPFSQVATQGGGGPQGCAVLSDIAARLPSSFTLDDLAVGTVSFPIAIGNGEYALIQVTSRTPAAFDTARAAVARAVQQKGASAAQRVVQAAERRATVSVDPRYGQWVPATAQVFVPFPPERSDVLNVGANTAPAFTGPTSS
jgi:PPIC-type PPIASE domain